VDAKALQAINGLQNVRSDPSMMTFAPVSRTRIGFISTVFLPSPDLR
jgi:hypothetical protein